MGGYRVKIKMQASYIKKYGMVCFISVPADKLTGSFSPKTSEIFYQQYAQYFVIERSKFREKYLSR